MESPFYMWSVVDENIVTRRVPVRKVVNRSWQTVCCALLTKLLTAA